MGNDKTAREKINCQKDFGVNHAKFSLAVKILKYAEVSLGWSTDTVKDAIGGLAYMMVAELALCETYRTSDPVEFSAAEYIDDQFKILAWFGEFIKAVRPLADQPAAGAAAKVKTDTESNVKKLIDDLAGLIVAPTGTEKTFNENIEKEKRDATLDFADNNLSDPQLSIMQELYENLTS